MATIFRLFKRTFSWFFSTTLFLSISLLSFSHNAIAADSPSADKFSFVVLGDFNGGGCGRNERVQDVINAADRMPNIDFFISTGDIIDGYHEHMGGRETATCFGRDPVATIGMDACPDGIPNGNMREMLAPLMDRTPKAGLDSSFYLTVGNHDDNWGSEWYPDSCGGGICDLMDESVIRAIVGDHVGNICSTVEEESTHSRPFYYSFSYKGSYFIVLKQNNDYASMLSCNGIGEGYSSCNDFCSAPEMVDDVYRNRMCYNVEQFDWLRTELESASSTHDNIFVFTHAVFLTGGDGHRPFSGAHKVRELLEQYDVKLAFNGHNHAYHRSHPIKGETISPDNGTTYLTVGSSGGLFNAAKTTEFTAKRHQDWTGRASSGREYEQGMSTYSKVDVDGENIKVSTYNLLSETVAVDEFTIGEFTEPEDNDTGGDSGSDTNTGDLETGDADQMVAVNGASASGAIDTDGDVDTYQFNVVTGQSYRINASGFDIKIKLLDEDGDSITDYIDNDVLPDDGEEFTFIADTTGVASVQLEHADGYTNPTGTYELAISTVNAPTAFPGATGFGAKATGGRGGRVIKVTNLNASGSGSLQDALEQNEPRIIVFDVSGVIESKEPIVVRHGNVTIAGQTAPGAGITIKGRLYGAYDEDVNNIIVRHLRVRPHDFSEISGVAADQYDAVQFSKNSQLIFDHVSVGFGVDESFDVYSAKDVTVQWSIIQEGATTGENAHNFGLISGPEGKRISVNNNLFVNNANRNPAIANGPAEVLNNVIYNARHGFIHHNPASGNFNIAGNYFKQGPNDSLHPFYFDDTYINAKYFLADNYVNDPEDPEHAMDQSVDNPWDIPEYFTLDKPESVRAASKFDFTNYSSYVAYQETSSVNAYDNVLALAGNFPRDVVDIRDVDETQNGGGEWGARIPADLMQGLQTTVAPTDSDNDGMPDEWETTNQLNPSVADNNTVMPSGYTAIEEYINELADNLLPTSNDNDGGDDNNQPVEYTVSLNVDPNDGGQVQGAGIYQKGNTATLTAQAAEGYQFVGWRGDITSTENPLTISVEANMSVTADFEAAPSGSVITDLFDEGDRAGTWVNFKDAVLLKADGSVAQVGDRVKTIQPIRGTASDMVSYGEGYYLRQDNNGNPYLEATGDDAYEFIMPATSLSYVIAWAAKVDPAENQNTNQIFHGAVDYHYYEVYAGYKGTGLKIYTGWSGKIMRELGESFTTDPHVVYYQHHWTGPYSPEPGDLYYDGENINNGTERGGNYKVGGYYKLSLLGQNWNGNMERMITGDIYGFVVLDGHHPDKVDAIHAELEALYGEGDDSLPDPDLPYEGDATLGQVKSVSCAACHGVDGMSTHDLFPNLAGQRKGYLMKQLSDFKDGTRYDELMSEMAIDLTDEDIADLAKFYSEINQ